jgi:hypothetical protein
MSIIQNDGYVETTTESGETMRLYESDLEMEWGLLEIEKGENSIEVNLDDLIQFFYNNGLEVKPMKMSV